jgi:hypothetical protein
VTYTYLACDLRTNAILAELPLQVSGDIPTKLNGYGEFTATLNLNAKGMNRLDLPSICAGGRTALYIDRDGVLVWGGILWGGRREQERHEVTLRFKEFESYLSRRLITSDYTPGSPPPAAPVDQLLIAQTLVNNAQAVGGGGIGIIVGTETSGVLRTRDYFRTSLQAVGEALRALTTLERGFDMYISVAYTSAGVPTKTLRLGYPRLGRGASASGFDFQQPGNITAWTDEWDAFTDSTTDHYELGEGEGSSTHIVHASRPTDIAAGWPVLESVGRENRSVSNNADLVAHARETLTANTVPIATFSCEVKANADPVLGSYIPGDEARFRLFADDWWRPDNAGNPTLDRYLRILSYAFNPSTDRVSLTLGAAR